MERNIDKILNDENNVDLTRRMLLGATGAGIAAFTASKSVQATAAVAAKYQDDMGRFPYFKTLPVSYQRVTMEDAMWAPRQNVIRDVTISWATRHWDAAGGLDSYRTQPASYRAKTQPGDMEALKFIEAMATAVGLKRDAAIEGLIEEWSKILISGQGSDGYIQAGFGLTISHPSERWQPSVISHEDYFIGHYLEAAIAYREATGKTELYNSALRAIDNMAKSLLETERPYLSGHPEIEQALMRLYGLEGNRKYLNLCKWIIEKRGNHNARESACSVVQDHMPIKEQRTIEGHAVRAAFLFNGVTEYVGATGEREYREATLAVWDDLVKRKLYLHGASGNTSSNFEGYLSDPFVIPPDDTYGESCSVFGNFQWAHNLFRLTEVASYIDVAERMLYSAFYASLSLQGDRYFYRNASQVSDPVLRYDWHAVPRCPPNIVKLFCTVGGYFYSFDNNGVFVKHYGASTAEVPFRNGLRLIQRGSYPWNGEITLQVEPKVLSHFTIRLRIPQWAKSFQLFLNGKKIHAEVDRGWAAIRRTWRSGDTVNLNLPMLIERVRMPAEFKDYRDLVALQRGPIVYCLDQQDCIAPLAFMSLPESAALSAEHRPDLLGGVTVIKGTLPQKTFMHANTTPVAVQFIPYGVWNNRSPGAMTIWLPIETQPMEQILQELGSKWQCT